MSSRPFSSRKYDKDEGRQRRAKLRAELFAKQNGLCWICGKPMDLVQRGKGTKNFATFDHLKPAAEGGTAYYTNLALAHGRCNSARNHKPVCEVVHAGVIA